MLVERQHDGGVDAGLLEQLEPLLVIGEQLRRRLGPHDRRRMAIERDDRRLGVALGGDRPHLSDHRLMTEVQTVVGADRDDGRLVRERLRRGVGDDQHAADATGRPRWEARRRAWPRASRNASYTASRRRSPSYTAHGPAPSNAGSTRPLAIRAATSVDDRHRGSERTAASTGSSAHVVGRAGRVDRELADRGAAQVAQVGAAAEQIARDRRRACARTCPAEHATSIASTPGSGPGSTSNEWTVTGRGARSTSIPSRASSCSRRPPILIADTIGGTCSIAPVRWSAATGAACSIVTRRHVVRGGHLAGGVERRRLDAEHDLADVVLARSSRRTAAAWSPCRRRRRARRWRRGRACRRDRPGARRTAAAACPRRRDW